MADAPKHLTPEVAVTQEDREAVLAYLRSEGCPVSAKMTIGYAPDALVQAFARHRLAASTPSAGGSGFPTAPPPTATKAQLDAGLAVMRRITTPDRQAVADVVEAVGVRVVEREEMGHGLGPHATVIEDDPDGFDDVALLVGTGTVYLQQGEAQVFLGFKQADAILAALSRRGVEV